MTQGSEQRKGGKTWNKGREERRGERSGIREGRKEVNKGREERRGIKEGRKEGRKGIDRGPVTALATSPATMYIQLL